MPVQLDASRVDRHSKGLLGWDLEVGTTGEDTTMFFCGCRVVRVPAGREDQRATPQQGLEGRGSVDGLLPEMRNLQSSSEDLSARNERDDVLEEFRRVEEA